MVKTDFYIAHFTAFQEPEDGVDLSDRAHRLETFRPYCQEIPGLGKTYMSLDLLDRDAREMPVGLKVIEEALNPETKEVEFLRTLTEVEPKVYKNGVAEIRTTFDRKGRYVLIAAIGEDAVSEDEQIRVPLKVGFGTKSQKSSTSMRLVPVLVVLALVGGFLAYDRSKRKSP